MATVEIQKRSLFERLFGLNKIQPITELEVHDFLVNGKKPDWVHEYRKGKYTIGIADKTINVDVIVK